MNINKRAMEYARNYNYYKPSKIKTFLRLYDKKMKYLEDSLKNSKCPECGSSDTYVEHDDRDYSSDVFMCCDICGNAYDDEDYLNRYSQLYNFSYFDDIKMSVWVRNGIPGSDYKWFKKCDTEMDRMIKVLSSQFD